MSGSGIDIVRVSSWTLLPEEAELMPQCRGAAMRQSREAGKHMSDACVGCRLGWRRAGSVATPSDM